MKRKGFTLIELLAVIVILAVVALITIPIINDIIEKANMEAFRDTGYGLVESAQIYFAKNLEGNIDTTFTFPNDYNGLMFKGEVPKGGTLKIQGRQTELFVYNDKYCASKGLDTDIVSVGKLEKNSDGSIIGCGIKLTDEKNCIEPVITENPGNDTWSKEKTVTINYSTTSKCGVKEYRIDDGAWEKYENSLILNDNAKVEARTVSATAGLETSPVAVKNVVKIDNVSPYASASLNNGKISISATDYAQNNRTPSGINSSSYKIKLDGNLIAEKTNETNITIDTTKENEIKYEVADNATNKYEGSITISGSSGKTSYCSIPNVSIDKEGWAHDKTATVTFSDCDIHEYSIDGTNWTTYTEPLNFTQNTVLRVRNRSNDSTIATSTLIVNIIQIDSVSPYTPILLNYSTIGKSIDNHGYECTTNSTNETEVQKCAIWVNCKEGLDENGQKICRIPLNLSKVDNVLGSGVRQTKYKYKFMKDGNEVSSSNEYSLLFNDGSTTQKDISVYNIKVYDLVGNESNDLELTIYWNATKKGSLQNEVSVNFEVGNYIEMIPSADKFELDSTYTGVSNEQMVNPKDLKLWRVIRINDDKSIDMVSDLVAGDANEKHFGWRGIEFMDTTGYKNIVGYLNMIAAKFENSKFTVGSRYMGYNGQTEFINTTGAFDGTSNTLPWRCSTGGSCNPSPDESLGGGDNLSNVDMALVRNVYGNLKARESSNGVEMTSYAEYFVSGRNYYFSGNLRTPEYYFGVNKIDSSGEFDITGSLRWYSSSWDYGEASAFLRVITTLKPGIASVGGTGTKANPYTLE